MLTIHMVEAEENQKEEFLKRPGESRRKDTVPEIILEQTGLFVYLDIKSNRSSVLCYVNGKRIIIRYGSTGTATIVVNAVDFLIHPVSDHFLIKYTPLPGALL